MTVFNGIEYEDYHGSPFDRGRADYYYGRGPGPHKWLDDVGRKRVEVLTEEEISAYMAGYACGKEWGEQKEY
jgi:hypothetical protein